MPPLISIAEGSGLFLPFCGGKRRERKRHFESGGGKGGKRTKRKGIKRKDERSGSV